MARGFETGSDNEKIDELQKQLDDVLDSQIISVGGNENISIDSTRGQRNSASGDEGGIRSNEPIIHHITDVDEGGTPTGVFDKINIISSMAIIEHTSTPITLRFIQGPVKDGARIKITPKRGKKMDIESGGNILTTDTIRLNDGDFYELVKYSEAETGVTGGAYKIFLSAGGGSGVSFPIDFPEEKRGGVGNTTEIIDFTQSDRHSVVMELTGDIGLSLTNTTTDELQITSIKLKQDGIGGHAFIGFSQTVANEQVIIDAVTANNAPNGFVSFIVEWEDNEFTAYLKTGNNVIVGGIDEPIIFGINELTPQTLPTTTELSWATKNPQHIVLDRAVEFNFTNLPLNGSYEGVLVIIDIDSIGGFASPTWPGSVVNPPVIPTTADQRFSVMLYTINAGSTVTHATSVGSSTGGEFFGPWTANHDAGVNSLVNLAAAAIVDTGGLPRGTIFGDPGNSSLGISLVTGGKLQISDVITTILEIDDATGIAMQGTHVINMKNNNINTVATLQFSNANAHTPSNELSIAFDTNDDALKYSVPLTTSLHMFFADTDLLATFSRVGSNEGLLSIQAVTATFLQATETLFLSTFNNTTPTNGDVWRDSGDGKFKFQENGVTQELGGLSNEIIEDDSSVLVTDIGIPADAKIEFILNGGIVGAFTPISFAPTIPIDMIIGLDILNIDNLRFLENTGIIPLATTGFVPDSNGLRLNLESGADLFTLTYNSTTVTHQWSNSAQTSPNLILNNTLTIQDSSSTPFGNGNFARDGNVLGVEIPEFSIRRTSATETEFTSLNIVKADFAPNSGDQISRLNYQIDDTGTITTYAQTRAEIRDATDAGRLYLSVRADNSSLVDAIEIIGDDNNLLSFMNVNARISSDLVFGVESGATDLKIFPQVNTMGITFNNISYTVGSAGTNQIPHVDTLPANAAGADAAFGDAQGALGIFDNDSNTFTIFGRQEDGNWAAVTLTRDVLT